MEEGSRFDRIEQLFEEASRLPEEQRQAFLDRACAGDAALRDEVAAMLAGDRDAEAWFDRLSLNVQNEVFAPEPGEAAPGTMIGAFRVIRQIGRGGMGEVYLVERSDRQFDQIAALKLIRSGRESSEVVRRFLAERQILSRLNHPGIARLFDGGLTAGGRPYFVMEYIDGRPLNQYCADSPPVAERLRLFLEVAVAVEYAHRNLVVHRDLKPGNILVTAETHVKLLDFGIAKVLDAGGAAGSETQTGAFAMTPDYAAPEQLRGEAVTTVTDVYGLGCVLYEMLTGLPPVRGKKNLAELQRAILDEDPALPSVTCPGLRKELTGDLDMIVMKALQKQPERRYQSATQMVEDVSRHMKGLPVLARRDSLAYRMSKFIRRHRLAVGAVASVVLVTTAAATALAIQSVRLQRERDKAQQVSELMVDLFEIADPGESRGATVTAREVLDRGVDKVSSGLQGQREVQAALLDVMGRVYHKLGLYERAGGLMERSLALRRAGGAQTAEVAAEMHALGRLRHDQGKYADAAALLTDALAMRRRILGAQHPLTAETLTYLGLAHFRRNDYKTAEPLFREAIAVERNAGAKSRIALADSLTGLALVEYGKGSFAASEPLLRESLALYREARGRDHPQVADNLNNLASVLSRLGRDSDAEPMQREAVEVLRRSLGPDHPKVATTLNNFGLILYARGDWAGAEPLFRESLAIRRARLGAKHPDVAQTLGNLGLLLHQSGRLSDADPVLVEALEIRRASLGARHVNIVQSLNNLGQLRQEERDYAAAERLLKEALQMAEVLLAADHPTVAISLNNLAGLYAEMGRAEAEPMYRRALEIRRAKLPAGHPHTAYSLLGLGEWLVARHRARDAEPLLREALSIREKALPRGHWEIAEVNSALGACLLDLDRRAEAEPLVSASYPALRQVRGESAAVTRRAHERWLLVRK